MLQASLDHPLCEGRMKQANISPVPRLNDMRDGKMNPLPLFVTRLTLRSILQGCGVDALTELGPGSARPYRASLQNEPLKKPR